MDFRTFVRVLVMHWKVVVAALLACLVGSAAITISQNKRYEASATVLISFTGQNDLISVFQATQAVQERLSSYAQVAGSSTVAERAINQIHDPISVDSLVSHTHISYTPKSLVLTITVSAAVAPQRVAALTGALADQFAAVLVTLDAETRPGGLPLPVNAPIPVSHPSASNEPTASPLSDAATADQVPAEDPQQPVGESVNDHSLDDGEQAPVLSANRRSPSPVAVATVVEHAEIPDRPISPVPTRNIALGLIAGVVLGIGAALSRQAADRSVRDREKLEELSRLPTLAELPGRRGGVPRFGIDASFDDAMRSLRTRLLKVLGPEDRRVLVTAPFGGEGSTTTALNLALAFAELGEDVVLVEGDPRKSVIAGLLGVDSGVGLSNLLADRDLAVEAVWKTAVPNLSVVASRKARRTPTLPRSNDLPEVLTQLCDGFDRMVIDGPPVLASADTCLLAGAAHATVFTARAGRTTFGEVNDALHALRSVGAEIVGTVLTDAQVSRHVRAAARTYQAKVGRAR